MPWNMNFKMWGTLFCAALLGIAILGVAYCTDERASPLPLNFAICLSGFSLGWLAGILFSPYDAKENMVFSNTMKGISAFASGYLVSKLDKVFEKALETGLFLSPVFFVRLAMFAVCFVLALIVVYAFRVYTKANK